MNRRTFLAALLGLCALAPARLFGATAAGGDRPDLARRLVGALRRPDSAAAVGRAYLAGCPWEASPSRLVEGICGPWRAEGFDPAGAGRRELRRRIAARVRRDFAEGRVVEVEGWVLAATEARLFALAALPGAGRGV